MEDLNLEGIPSQSPGLRATRTTLGNRQQTQKPQRGFADSPAGREQSVGHAAQRAPFAAIFDARFALQLPKQPEEVLFHLDRERLERFAQQLRCELVNLAEIRRMIHRFA